MSRTEYLLICAIEECAELQKNLTKALRFGLDDTDPNEDNDDKFGKTNVYKIVSEFNDILAIIEILEEDGELVSIDEGNSKSIESWKLKRDKKEKLAKWMEYSESRGIIDKKYNDIDLNN